MAAVSVYEYKEYKKFVLDWIAQAPHGGRGIRKNLAAAINCQTPFITHVLAGDYHFSAEQAEACARWMQLPEEEIEFFLLLVMRSRAGTRSLENLLTRQISARREEQAALKKRVKIPESLSEADQAIYYSSWQYSAVHLSLLNPAMQTIEGLQAHMQLPTARLLKILEFLTGRGLVRREKQLYKVAKPFLHLEPTSPLIFQHHSNWRMKALDSMASRNAHDTHYSGVASLSHEDFEWVRERLSVLMEEISEKVKKSADEKLAALTFDWFGI